MTQRILSISGLRGVIGDGLDPVYISEFAAALGTWANGGTVVVSRDGRATGLMVKHAVNQIGLKGLAEPMPVYRPRDPEGAP